MYQVYKIKDQYGNIIYIGVTKDSKGYIQRFKEHQQEALRGDNCLLHKRMRKEGVDNFTPILMLHDISEIDIDFYEKLWIQKYDTYYKSNSLGCNMTYGGGGCLGYVFTPEVRSKQGKASKSYWTVLKQDPDKYKELCLKRSQAMKGIPKSTAHKKKLSEWASTRTGEKNPFYGKHHTQEMKHKLTLANGIPVLMLDKTTHDVLCSFESALQAGRYIQSLGITKNKTPNDLILEVCHGRLKSAYGYAWKFQHSVTTISDESNMDIATM